MPTWLIIVLGIAGAVLVGLLIFFVASRVDKKIDILQRRINKLENMFAAAGTTWMAEFLEDLVVGDRQAIVARIRQLVEADDTTEFFLRQVAVPCAQFAIRKTRGDYPDLYKTLVEEFKRGEEAAPAVAPAAPVVAPAVKA